MTLCLASLPQRAALVSLLVSCQLFLHVLPTTAETPTQPIKANCTGQTYTQNSLFATSLTSLLSLLTTKSSSSNSGTANVTGSVYGLYMCQGDLPGSDCSACVGDAASTITTSCPGFRQGVIWYDNCELRYSDFYFLNVPNTAGFNMSNPFQRTTSAVPFKVVADLVSIAPLQKPLMFALRALADDGIYALAQCSVDLSANGCRKCLNSIPAEIKSCCTGYLGWRYLATSCWVRYEPTPFLHVLPPTTDTTAQPIKANCTGQTYTQNSLFATNLASLLSLLTTKSSSFNSGTANVTGSVYGLYMCQGDLPGSDCSACVGDAASTITTSCPGFRQGVIWYDNCELRYSDLHFFGTADTAGFNMSNPFQRTTSAAPFKVVADLVSIAPLQNPLMFALRALADDGIYALAQCSVDLSADGCRKCLNSILAEIKSCCTGYLGWRYLATSCWVRYEPTSFLHVLPPTTDTTAQPIKANCTGQTYTQNRLFATNLASLLSLLTTKSSSSNSDTANVTESIYGLYMCQGDLPSSDCSACISAAAATITASCPGSRQGVIWYDNCELRYSDFYFLNVPNTAGFNMSNPFQRATSAAPFKVVADLVSIAPLQNPLMFASRALADDGIYALAQCSVDLSADGCRKCLNSILAEIKSCCTGYLGWRYLATSCWVRYEATPFLRNANATYTEVTLKNCSLSTFAPNQLTVMESDLNNLLSNLTVEARTSGYHNTTIGSSFIRLYGLGLCRGDLVPPNNDCNVCLDNAARTLAGDCLNSTEGIKWYEKCLMRYSDQNFFGQVDMNGEKLCGVKPIGQAASDATIKLAESLVAAAVNSPLMVAAQGQDVGSSLSSYVLVQCTRDLSSESCKSCLERGLDAVTNCSQTNGWRYLSGSCTLRFEDFPFFNTSAISSPAPPPMTDFSPQGNRDKTKKLSNAKIAAIVTSILGSFFFSSILFYLRWKLRRRNVGPYAQFSDLSPLPDTDLPLMDLAVIQAATSNFLDKNKLGEGGFGPVYKGIIHGGKEIAVKRLSKKSRQGSAEFRNEAKLIAKLQHKNLVKMLGCCIEREEKLLIYEFLSNKSLDAFLFDPNKRALLDWNRRVQIIAGIARGLLYLHEDSRLKVIHRDLKASNVLLDNEMNPKISDFGMAKIYGPDESEVNTNRIVGTYGYMAPEYAMDDLFSVKSDVYSFGVLLLEIVSGERNGRSHYERHGQTLLRHAWQLWNEDRAMELIDSLLAGSYPVNDAKKCIHIGLLCVQENLAERPTMSLVVHMLQGDDESVIPPPAQPPTFARHQASASNSSSNTDPRIAHSINELTESIVEPR